LALSSKPIMFLCLILIWPDSQGVLAILFVARACTEDFHGQSGATPATNVDLGRAGLHSR
jgi:hypothetical protein